MGAIYNHYVESDTCTFRTDPEPLDERVAWLARHGPAHPVFVAEADGRVVGWASLSPWNSRCGYRATVEDSVYLDPHWRGRGLGAALLQRLVEAAVACGHHRMIAAISADQARSVALHQRFGFVEVGRMTEVGHKFGRWLDVVYLQLRLPPVEQKAQPPTEVDIEIFDAGSARANLDALGALLIDAVEGGASVGFMAPLSSAQARSYWETVAERLARGTLVLLGARKNGQLVGAVQLVPSDKDNARHRAEIAKLLVHRRLRRQGIGRQLMAAIETEARTRGHTLLVLDTQTGSAAEALYRRLGYTAAGQIPAYACLPDGPSQPTTLMWRFLGASAEVTVEKNLVPGPTPPRREPR